MAATSSTLVSVPTKVPVTPNFGNLNIRNDVLYPKGEEPYTGWDLHIRIALFVLSQVVPILAAILLVFSRKSWWQSKYNWSISRFMAYWILSVEIFAIIVFVNEGASTRTTYVLGAMHLQIEYMIIALLLKSSALQALGYAYVGGSILFSLQLFLPDFSLLFMATTIGGFPDVLLPVLFAYGKQWYFAIGALAHLVQAGAAFGIAVKNYGHLAFNVLTFFSTIIMNGTLVYAVFNSSNSEGRIRLVDDDGDNAHNGVDKSPSGEAFDNPLAHVNIPRSTLIKFFGGSLVATTTIAFGVVFVFARD